MDAETRAKLRSHFLSTPKTIQRLRRGRPDAGIVLDALERRLATLDLDAFFDEAVPQKARNVLKYLDLAPHVVKNYDRLKQIGLTEGPPRRILDLGTGSAAFCFVAEQFGHQAMGLERPVARRRIRYSALHRLYGVTVTEQTIEARKPLVPDSALTGRFDVVTAVALTFNVTNGMMWNAPDYLFLYRDLRDNFLNNGARVAFLFNGAIAGNKYEKHNQQGEDYYRSLGRMLEPFAIDPLVANIAVLDVFRGELETDVVLPVVNYKSLLARRTGGAQNDDDEEAMEETA